MKSNEQKKILIIDDDKVFLDSMCEIFKVYNFDVFEAQTAETGYEALVEIVPDVVLLDINLPDKNGFEVLKTIRESKNFADMIIILITGDSTVDVDNAFDSGADDCVFKPIDVENFILRINKLLKK
jgi:DNA-binding response OmpR family regulator